MEWLAAVLVALVAGPALLYMLWAALDEFHPRFLGRFFSRLLRLGRRERLLPNHRPGGSAPRLPTAEEMRAANRRRHYAELHDWDRQFEALGGEPEAARFGDSDSAQEELFARPLRRGEAYRFKVADAWLMEFEDSHPIIDLNTPEGEAEAERLLELERLPRYKRREMGLL